MAATLSGRLPDDDRNGLSPLSSDLVSDPEKVRVAVVLLDCIKVTRNVDTGEESPTIRIRAIEPVVNMTTDASEMRRLLRRAYERRTGKVELPLELERELDILEGEESNE